MTQTILKCKKSAKRVEELSPFIPGNNRVLYAATRWSLTCYLATTIISLITGIMLTILVLIKPKDCIHLHIQKLGSFLEPPPHEDLARVARYIMHTSDWCSMSTFSTHEGIEGFPFGNIFSVSDGSRGNSSGIPYFFATDMDLSVIDLKVDDRASLTLTESQSDYCKKKGYDPQSPLCGRIILTGRFQKVTKGSVEEDFARDALFSRHSEMAEWPADHKFFFAKLNISHIYILDYFGGASTVPLEDYFNASPLAK